MASTVAPPSGTQPGSPVRVMVVDDSAVIRGLITRWLSAEPDFDVVASCQNGVIAVNTITRAVPDVVILDIEMPEMDGMTALPKLLAALPDVRVIMASTLTRRNADISLRALSLGAADYVAKPESAHGVTTSEEFRRTLIEKVRVLGLARRQAGDDQHAVVAPSATAPARGGDVARTQTPPPAKAITLRPLTSSRPGILTIGSSTGGPQALLAVLSSIKGLSRIPIVIAQHMPPMFTAILAQHIERATGRPCAEGTDGAPVRPGQIYVAPGDHHMRLVQEPAGVVLRLDKGPRINFCRPSVDPLFDSAAGIYGAATLALVLTGMGKDGNGGAASIVSAGGNVIVQDRATSIVWGMPAAVAQAGLAAAMLPLEEIGPFVDKVLEGRHA